MRFSLDTRPNPVTPTAHSRNHRTVLISKKQTSNLHSIRGYHNRNLCLHSALLARFHYFQNHEFTRTEKGLWGGGGGRRNMKRIRSVIHYFKDTWQWQRWSKSRQFHRRCRVGGERGGGGDSFSNSAALVALSSSFPPSRRWQSSPSSTIWRFPLDLTAR